MTKQYSHYKDSGVVWLGEVPKHWDIKRFKYIANLYTGDSLNDKQKEMYGIEIPNGIPYISSKDIDLERCLVNYENGLKIPKEEEHWKVAPEGSWLLCIEGGSAGRKIAYIERTVTFVNKLCCFNSLSNENKFQYFFAQSKQFCNNFESFISGLIGGVSVTTLSNFKVPLRLIKLLKEKRQALISHAVTKGLDPNVPMKDSGVEWLGEVPQHWDIVPIKYIGLLRGGAGFPIEEQGKESEEIPFFKVNSLAQNEANGMLRFFEHSISQATARKLGAYIFPKGTIVFAKVGAALLLGRIRILGHASCIDNNMMGLEIRQDLFFLGFVQYALQLVRFDYISNPGTVPSLNEQQIGCVLLAMPCFIEQKVIAAHLERESAKIDSLIADSTAAIDLLKEKRSALISAVVTGKVDVRHLVEAI
jgi:type I restriction enzyme S subunit